MLDTDWIDKPKHPMWAFVRLWAKEAKSDGCTDVPDFFVDCCYYHDRMWEVGIDFAGNPITTAEANRRFRKCIQSRSIFGRFDPMSWWRWLGVTLGEHVIPHKSK